MQTVEEVVAIPLAKLKAHPDNPRKKTSFAKAKLEPLEHAIEENGITPLVVRELDDSSFQVLSGHRRQATLEQAGEKTAPCVVRAMDDFHALRFVLADNAQHEDPDPFLEARAIAKLLKEPGATLENVAAGIGWSVRKVARRRELLNLCKTILEDYQDPTSAVSRWPVSWLEAIVQLDEVVQERWIKDVFPADVSSLDEIEASVAQYLRQLGKAPWDLNDANLVAKAGSCAACPKQSANERNAGLFGVEKKADAGDVNKATCRDAQCFKKKLDVWTGQQVKKKLDANPELVCLRATDTGYHGKAERLETGSARVPKGVEKLDRWAWEACAKDDKGAKQGLLVSGPTAGKTQWFKPKADRGDGAPSSPPKEPSVKALLKQAEANFEKTRASAFGQHVADLIRARDAAPDADDVLALMAVSGLDSSPWKQIATDHADAVAALEAGSFSAFIWPSVREAVAATLEEAWRADAAQLRGFTRIVLAALVDATEVTAIEERVDEETKAPAELEELRLKAAAKPTRKKKAEPAAKGADPDGEVDDTPCTHCPHDYGGHSHTTGACKTKGCDCGSFEPAGAGDGGTSA